MAKNEKPYIVLLTDDTSDAKRKTHTLNKSEWTYLEELFRKHSWLARIECPERSYSSKLANMAEGSRRKEGSK